MDDNDEREREREKERERNPCYLPGKYPRKEADVRGKG